MQSFPKKVAIVSHALPPAASGQAVILYRLLRDIDPASYCLLSTRDYGAEADDGLGVTCVRLPATYHCLTPDRLGGQLRGPALYRGILRAGQALTQGRQRAREIERIIRSEDCQAVLACSGNILDIPAAAQAAQRCGLPFYAYIFDDYVTAWTRWRRRLFARLTAMRVFPHAAGVIVPNDFLGQVYRQRYGIAPTVIHNATTAVPGSPTDEGSNCESLRIVYTGSIYAAHYDALRNLCIALAGIDSARLHLYTNCPADILREQNIVGPVVRHDSVMLDESVDSQQRSDVLFLPLAFESAYPEIIRTAAPAKMGDYLASGRPTLVHAPRDSFVSWYFRRHQCGVVVDEPSPVRLAEALRRLQSDPSSRRRIVENALNRAQCDFQVGEAQRRLVSLLASSAHTTAA